MRRSRRRRRGRYSKQYGETLVGVAWYDRGQWTRLRQVAADPERLEESYEEWVAMAEKAIRDLKAQGMRIQRVPVDAEDLIGWCKEQARRLDTSARAEFTSHQLRKLHLSK
ncbi:MAG: hypothetical protein ACE5JX_02930 [Acidobacteriota bacterium]